MTSKMVAQITFLAFQGILTPITSYDIQNSGPNSQYHIFRFSSNIDPNQKLWCIGITRHESEPKILLKQSKETNVIWKTKNNYIIFVQQTQH